MSQRLWTAVDHYIAEKLLPPDPILNATLKANAEADLPAFDVPPTQGKFLHLLARIQGAKKVLEIGTLGGYSTIWLARALPLDGLVVTLESDEKHLFVARANVKRAEVPCSVDFRLGPALASLERLKEEGVGPFDLIFIDADKENNPAYLEWSIRLARAGTVIVGDNVVREGAILDPRDPDLRVQGIRRFFDMTAADSRLCATALQTVGNKGYDGFSIALVTHA